LSKEKDLVHHDFLVGMSKRGPAFGSCAAMVPLLLLLPCRYFVLGMGVDTRWQWWVALLS
jgi:hypothetical protein